MGRMKGDARKAAAGEGARTVPPREHGGNCDIKNLSRGSTVYFPVYVKGGGLSMGDIHFSQGDGEITFCGAIEMAGYLDLRVSIIKEGMAKYGVKNPIFKTGPMEPRYSSYLIFEGISVDEAGKQHYLDVHVAYRQACLNAIEYLKKFGYTGAQAYAILGTAPVEGRISGIVDIPNACATLAIPTEIFGFDLKPSATSPVSGVAAGRDPRVRAVTGRPSHALSTNMRAASTGCSKPIGPSRSSTRRARVPSAIAVCTRVLSVPASPARRSIRDRVARDRNERSRHEPKLLTRESRSPTRDEPPTFHSSGRLPWAVSH